MFCEKGEQEGELHQILTLDADSNVRAMVTERNNVQLLARIVGGDLIAMEVKYHLKCMVNLRNRIAVLSGRQTMMQGFMIAMEVKYHLKCMVNLRNRIAVLSGRQTMMQGFILRRKLSSLVYLLS